MEVDDDVIDEEEEEAKEEDEPMQEEKPKPAEEPKIQVKKPEPLVQKKPEVKSPGPSDMDVDTPQKLSGGSPPPKQEESPKKPEPSKKLKDSSIDDFTPIEALSTFNTDWMIRARIMKKYPVKTFNKRGGEGTGKILNIDLVDAHGGQIQATFFSEAVDAFDPKLKQGKVYLFSKGNIKPANTKFTSIKHHYAITFGPYANIQEVQDAGDID